ncbi:MAG: 2-C-methyl-D-erythritol 4-phosphate cytidylyltransferase [Firmicutes bacterium HGW-Firmicutes-13]|nr:MAG: 2-C-methyl-D-erythritol 4-phosphate cytidylyltransferase [Firmicutes bacterium HGW-Firmicutes-13]
MRVAGIVAAAGRGKRMGHSINKQYLLLAGRPVLAHTLEQFSRYPFDEIILVAAPGEEQYCKNEILDPLGLKEKVKVVPGGKERQDSIFNALKCAASQTDVVVVHDGVRPFISLQILEDSIKTALRYGAAVTAVPVKDTIKITNDEDFVVDTPSRHLLWAAQTPQTFRYDIICEAYQKAFETGFQGTDDASLVERLGFPVKINRGSYNNFKITTPEDLHLAELLLKQN